MKASCKDCAYIRENVKPYMKEELKGNKTQYCWQMDDQMDMETGFCQDFQLHKPEKMTGALQYWRYSDDRWFTFAECTSYLNGREMLKMYKEAFPNTPYRLVTKDGEIYQ